MLPSILLTTVLALAALPQTASACTPKCCEHVVKPNDGPVGVLLGLLGVVVGDLEGLVGLECVGPPCTGSLGSTCCSGATLGGSISIGCTPINI